MNFYATGSNFIEVFDGILVNYATGEFNKEGIDEAWQQIKSKVDKCFKGKEWCFIDVVGEKVNATADAVVQLRKEFDNLENLNCRAIFIVCNNCNIAQWYLEKIMSEQALKSYFFDSQEDAFHAADQILAN